MIETAENLRREYNISREEQDAWALRSHQRAVAAQTSGKFDAECVPVTTKLGKQTKIVTQDEHPRADAS
ncbi:acetyl-CoA C-acyltransferase, partial [Parvimonas sp. D2]|nr:acetyl-CoA C-acyltransferase [Parvimonas sp. D2]